MARPLRVEYPGAFYHVINRGNAGETIFKSKSDRKRFFECLERAVERFSIKIHTYCLMTNHYHLLVESPYPNLSRTIQWINVSYVHILIGNVKKKAICFKDASSLYWLMQMNTSNICPVTFT